ncbi:MarC family protein [Variovorax sp. J22P168]|uniref:MarC family protein n=1 Tax=Variovorax jilinensis TaxID=3053513 RepID=UPI002574F489|nr:MarC family protein [Variovorax sp. J22P168]MDM0013902.1 MarC family protein [Variovorax sp. J22P168]
MHDANSPIGLSGIFTVLFVMLGPLKIIGPFVQFTHAADQKELRKIAFRTFAIALCAVVLGAVIGLRLLSSWEIPVPALLLSGGLIFFVVGMRMVLEQYQPGRAAPIELPPSPIAAAMRITFPTVVTPYGIAALVVLLANSHTLERTMTIFAMLFGVMLLNLLAMLYGRRILDGAMAIVLQILGAVLGVLQVALAVSIIFLALGKMGVLHVG